MVKCNCRGHTTCHQCDPPQKKNTTDNILYSGKYDKDFRVYKGDPLTKILEKIMLANKWGGEKRVLFKPYLVRSLPTDKNEIDSGGLYFVRYGGNFSLHIRDYTNTEWITLSGGGGGGGGIVNSVNRISQQNVYLELGFDEETGNLTLTGGEETINMNNFFFLRREGVDFMYLKNLPDTLEGFGILDGAKDSEVVKVVPQTLTEQQKETAVKNIGMDIPKTDPYQTYIENR